MGWNTVPYDVSNNYYKIIKPHLVDGSNCIPMSGKKWYNGVFGNVDGRGWSWIDVDKCGWMWMKVDGCGWMWMDVDGCERMCMDVYGCGFSASGCG